MLALDGDLDLAAGALMRSLSGVYHPLLHPHGVVVNLHDVTFVDCAGADLLARVVGTRPDHPPLITICPPGPVARALVAAGYARRHRLSPTVLPRGARLTERELARLVHEAGEPSEIRHLHVVEESS